MCDSKHYPNFMVHIIQLWWMVFVYRYMNFFRHRLVFTVTWNVWGTKFFFSLAATKLKFQNWNEFYVNSLLWLEDYEMIFNFWNSRKKLQIYIVNQSRYMQRANLKNNLLWNNKGVFDPMWTIKFELISAWARAGPEKEITEMDLQNKWRIFRNRIISVKLSFYEGKAKCDTNCFNFTLERISSAKIKRSDKNEEKIQSITLTFKCEPAIRCHNLTQ